MQLQQRFAVNEPTAKLNMEALLVVLGAVFCLGCLILGRTAACFVVDRCFRVVKALLEEFGLGTRDLDSVVAQRTEIGITPQVRLTRSATI